MGDLNGAKIVCGDCNAPDPEWAATNRGLLLCNDCCFIHRSLGPQYSHIQSIKDSEWTPSLWSMIMTLAGGSANHVWEHLLLDRPKAEREFAVKKPFPYDTLEVKRKFIQMKHFQFQFVPKTTPDQIEVKSQELHSTVRTGSVETTLRLLAGGADPNYFHPEKGTRPMHVAARNGQALQVELLHLHGAHSSAPDYLGQTPMEHAIAAGHKELAQRILQLRYALTDQLTYFVCNEVPDHLSTKHIIVPSIKSKSFKQESDVCNLASYLLEQLAADLLDEVGRRQIERLVHKKFGNESPKFSIAFLPVNPHYPAVRNQARQKFARLTDEELCSMISLVLSECEKRHWNGSSDAESESIFRRISTVNGKKAVAAGAAQPTVGSVPVADDDDYPLYDSVASDEDLILAEQQTFLAQQKAKLEETSFASSTNVTPVSSAQLTAYKNKLLLIKLMETESQILQIESTNRKLEVEVVTLQHMVKESLKENLKMLTNMEFGPFAKPKACTCHHGLHNQGPTNEPGHLNSKRKQSRPSSMSDLTPTPTTNLPSDPNHRDGKILRDTPFAHAKVIQFVELIKKIMSSAESAKVPTLIMLATELYRLVQGFVELLVSIEDVKHNMEIMSQIENLNFQALKLKHEIPVLVSTLSTLSEDPSPLVANVKQLCFALGGAMKDLIALVNVHGEVTVSLIK